MPTLDKKLYHIREVVSRCFHVETGSFHLTFAAPLEIYTHAALTGLKSLETTRFYKHAVPTGLMYERRGSEEACVFF